MRIRGTKLLKLLLLEALLLKDGSGCKLTAEFGLVMRLFNGGMGARVGSGSTVIGSEALEDEGSGCEEKIEKIEAGLGAWDNNAHPTRKDSTLVIVIQIRRANFNGFMDDSFLESAAPTLQELNRPVLGDANDAALL